jgi:hypothetical protein
MADYKIDIFKGGVQNLLDPENIDPSSAKSAYNWITKDGVIELVRGRALLGTEGLQGSIQGEGFGYKVNGDKVHYRKTDTKVQYYNGTTWVDIITGLTDGFKAEFVNYQSLAGTFTYVFSLDGIYKIHNANPASYTSLYDSAKNFKFAGAIIDKGRTIGWGVTKDKTGLYGSYIDTQKTGTVYTQVTGEATTSLTGTLAFKAGGATRTCFGVTITITTGGEVYTDNYDGTLTGSAGGTGTINYTTGAYTLSASGVGTAVYLWEDSNTKGVTDFTKSATRIAGEGFTLRQDEGGDAIVTVKVGLDGSYYSLKEKSAYQLTLDSADINPTNVVFRREIGIESTRGAVSTQRGIVFMNTANLERPECTILQQNPIGGNVEPFILFPEFKFANYDYTNAVMATYGQFILLSCKTIGADNNDTTLLMDIAGKKVDITGYGASTLVTDGDFLYMGSPLTLTVYKLFNGFDDDGTIIENFWEGKDEMFKVENLKKTKYFRIKGTIQQSQSVAIYVDYDSNGYQLIGTVLGNGSYVDTNSSQTIGSNMIGEAVIGGDDVSIVYPFYTQLKIKTPKFRKRTLKFVALGYGYVNIDTTIDTDILRFENKLPKKYRVKNYVSLNGETTDNNLPEY